MEHQLQCGDGSRSRAYRAEKKAVSASDLRLSGCDPVSMHRAHRIGNGQFRKLMNSSTIALDSTCGNGLPIEENSFAPEFKHNAPMKASVVNTEETNSRRPTPNVVAKLMGLDELPPPQIGHENKDIGSCLHNSSSAGFQEYVFHDDLSHWTCTSEHQELKDVFEIMETSNAEKHKSQPVQNGMSKNIRFDSAPIKQKLMVLRHSSSDETLQKSKEFNVALDVADSYKDHVHNSFEEPSSLFTKHLQDLKYSHPSSCTSHSTISESSKDIMYGNKVYSNLVKKAERCSYLQKDVMRTFRNPASSLFSHSLKEHGGSHLYNLPRPRNEDKVDTCLHPTEIVILRTTLDRNQNVARTFSPPRYRWTSQFGYRGQGEFWSSAIQELYAEGRGRKKLPTNAGALGHKTKSSREIAREITKKMRNSTSRGTRKEFTSRYNWHIRDGSLCGISDLNNHREVQQSCNLFVDWNSSYTPSSSYSNESSVPREARKCLSECWKVTHGFQGMGPVGRGSSTLGEMLALSDRETVRNTVHPWFPLYDQNVLDEKVARGEALEMNNYPLVVNGGDDWKAASFVSFPRSLSPAPSSAYGSSKLTTRLLGADDHNNYMLRDVINLGPDHSLDGKSNQQGNFSTRSVKCYSNKLQPFKSAGEENDTLVREIHVNPEGERTKVRVSNFAEGGPVSPVFAGNMVFDTGLAQNFLVSKNKNATLPPLSHLKQTKHPNEIIVTIKDGKSSVTDQYDVSIEETSYDQPPSSSISSHGDERELGSPVSKKEVEQPSPVSILEPPSEEENCSSGSFESVGADLQELWMQLGFLRLDSNDRHDEDSEEEAIGERQTRLQMEEIFSSFRDEEDRDFSYLLDILINSGVRDAYQDRLFHTCYSPEYPVGPSVFEKLEKKYHALETWSRSQRKMLFDLINSSLEKILAPCMDVQPWLRLKRKLIPKYGQEGLVEELWQMVVRQRKEQSIGNPENKVLESNWLDLEDDVNNLGNEIEVMLMEGILEEFMSEFVLG